MQPGTGQFRVPARLEPIFLNPSVPVSRILVRSGDEVVAGQVLAELDYRPIEERAAAVEREVRLIRAEQACLTAMAEGRAPGAIPGEVLLRCRTATATQDLALIRNRTAASRLADQLHLVQMDLRRLMTGLDQLDPDQSAPQTPEVSPPLRPWPELWTERAARKQVQEGRRPGLQASQVASIVRAQVSLRARIGVLRLGDRDLEQARDAALFGALQVTANRLRDLEAERMRLQSILEAGPVRAPTEGRLLRVRRLAPGYRSDDWEEIAMLSHPHGPPQVSLFWSWPISPAAIVDRDVVLRFPTLHRRAPVRARVLHAVPENGQSSGEVVLHLVIVPEPGAKGTGSSARPAGIVPEFGQDAPAEIALEMPAQRLDDRLLRALKAACKDCAKVVWPLRQFSTFRQTGRAAVHQFFRTWTQGSEIQAGG